MKHAFKRMAQRRVLALRVFRSNIVVVEVDCGLNRRDRTEEHTGDVFWAGRNFAMQRSARIAA